MEYEYRVIDVADGGVSTVLLGDGRIETAVLQAYLNAMAAEGFERDARPKSYGWTGFTKTAAPKTPTPDVDIDNIF